MPLLKDLVAPHYRAVLVLLFSFIPLAASAVHGQTLLPHPTPETINFGQSTALSGDGVTALVTSYQPGVPAPVYAYTRTDTGWAELPSLTPPPGATNLYGAEVALNYDGTRALISTPQNRTGDVVHAYVRSDSAWRLHGTIRAADLGASDGFGQSLALDSSGLTAVVGASQQREGQGAVYIFQLEGQSWQQQAKLTAPDGQSGDAFGHDVFIDEAGSTVLVGALGHEDPGTGNPSAYVYSRSGTQWTMQAKLHPETPPSTLISNIGLHLSRSGMYAVLTARATPTYPDGAAFVFHRSGDSWSQQAEVGVPADLPESSSFGQEAVLDANGNTLVVTQTEGVIPTISTQSAGQVFAFRRTGTTWSPAHRLPITGQRRLRKSMHLSLSNDGLTLLASEPEYLWGSKHIGAVYPLDLGRGATFNVRPPSIDRYSTGDTLTIGWASYNHAGQVNLDLYSDRGNFVESIAANIDNTGSYRWTVSKNAVGQRRIRVSSANNEAEWAFGATVFRVVPSAPAWANVLHNSDPDYTFGVSGAFSRMGAHALVRSQFGSSASRAVQAFGKHDGQWRADGFLVPPGVGRLDGGYGAAMALSDSGTIALVSAPDASHYGNNPEQRALFAFERQDTAWVPRTVDLGFLDLSSVRRIGQRIALSGDGQHAVIWAEEGDERIFMLRREAGTAGEPPVWRRVTSLFRPDAVTGGWFGTYLAINADGTVALVSSPFERHPDTQRSDPAVYVYRRAQNQWRQTARIALPEATELALNAQGNRAAIQLGTGGIAIFDFNPSTATWEQYAVLPMRSFSFDMPLTFSSSGHELVSVTENGSARLYHLRNPAAIQYTDLEFEDAFNLVSSALPMFSTEHQSALLLAREADHDPIARFGYVVNLPKHYFTTPPAETPILARTQPHPIHWATWGAPQPTPLDLTVTTTDGTPVSTIARGLPDTGEYFWAPDESIPEGAYRVQLQDPANPLAADLTDGLFIVHAQLPEGQQKLMLPPQRWGPYLGQQVAVNADATHAIVGEGDSYDDVHAFVRSGDRWRYHSTFPDSLTTGQPLERRRTGSTLAISADGMTALLGAPASHSFGKGGGYLYERTDSTWQFDRELTLPEAVNEMTLGSVVALSGDGQVAVLGGTQNLAQDSTSGVAYVFTRSPAGWRHQATLQAPQYSTGQGIAISYDGSVIAAGGSDNDAGGYNKRAIFLFARQDSTWDRTQALVPSIPHQTGLTQPLALSADGRYLAVGLPNHVGNTTRPGYAVLYHNTNGTWAEQAIFGGDEPRYATSVAIDSTGGSVLVGMASSLLAGRVERLSRQDTTWTLEQTLYPQGDSERDAFGTAVSLSYDGTIGFVGAASDSNAGDYNGSVYAISFVPVDQTAVEPMAPTENQLSAPYPNPVGSGVATLTLTTPISQQVDVWLYDALGRRIQHLYSGAVAAQTAYPIHVAAQSLASGLYFVRATSNTINATRPLIIRH